MKKRVIAIVMSGTVLGALGPVVSTAVSSGARAACSASNQSTAPTSAGPVYTSASPSSGPGTSGYVGAGGSAGGQGGYVEADGSAGPPPSGYIVASNGTSGAEVTSAPSAGQC